VQHNEGPGRFGSPTVSRRKDLLKRGVWQAPFLGPDGELVLAAVRRDGRLNEPPLVIPHGASRIDAAEEMLDRLNAADPIPDIRIV
jgi:hypothetical protein